MEFGDRAKRWCGIISGEIIPTTLFVLSAVCTTCVLLRKRLTLYVHAFVLYATIIRYIIRTYLCT